MHPSGLFGWLGREHLLLASLVAFSWGAMVFFGTLDTAAVVDIVAALALAGLALRAPAAGPSAGRIVRAGAAALCAAAALRYTGLFNGWQVMWLVLAIIAISALVSVVRWVPAVIAGGAVGAAAIVALAVSGWRWGRAGIDVFNLLQTATAALLRGQNPYTPTGEVLVQTQPHMFVHELFHFCYFPGAVLLTAPGRIVGDVRVISVLAVIALITFALYIAASSGGAVRAGSVLALCLAAPTTVAMIYNSWLDVYAVAGFAGWIALRHTHARWSTVCLVVALAVKPTLLLALLPFWLWSKRARFETAIAVGFTVLLFLPFALITGFSDFYRDVIGIYGVLGFRYDGLTLSAWWYQLTGSVIPLAFSVVAGAVAALFSLRRRPTDLSTALIAGAFLSTAGFLLAKQAFLNYYFIPTWLLILALAARGTALDRESDIALPAALVR